jgi:hypothetical protein
VVVANHPRGTGPMPKIAGLYAAQQLARAKSMI